MVMDKPSSTIIPTLPNSNKSLKVEESVINELLLVCGVIGSTTKPSSGKQDGTAEDERLVPVTDCLLWLQDLQRALRRDDDTYRPIALLIGSWKIVQTKLLPLISSAHYDHAMIITILKILVILTKPLSEQAKKAARMTIDTKSGKVPDSVIREQMKLRENAISQSDVIMKYKRAIVNQNKLSDSEHLKSSSSEGNGKSKGAPRSLLSTIVTLLTEPLAKKRKTDSDHLTIELVLHFIRNLLCAEPVIYLSAETHENSSRLQQELIVVFHSELVLDILLVLGQEMESDMGTLQETGIGHYNLLVMEILHYLVRGMDPTAVARAKLTAAAKGKPNKAAQTGSLRAVLTKEKRKLASNTISTTRHSHFGGTLMMSNPDGTRQMLSSVMQTTSETPTLITSSTPRRRNKKYMAFASDGASKQTTVTRMTNSAHVALSEFCTNFVAQCYGPLMKSLKNEFRRETVRLEHSDKLMFYKIIWFFSKWQRVVSSLKKSRADKLSVKQLIFSMDIFTFKMVLTSCATYIQLKQYHNLSVTVAVYSEMMHLLHSMNTSEDETEQTMALGLLHQLFYSDEPLDMLPKLLSGWKAGVCSRDYLADLVELTHVTLKLLDSHQTFNNATPRKKRKKNSTTTQQDRVTLMKLAAEEFNAKNYFLKLCSNQVVHMYTSLLTRYDTNAPHVNHHIIAFFVRMCKMVVSKPDEHLEGLDIPKEMKGGTVTLEPMLYNIHLLTLFGKILNDTSIAQSKEFSSTIHFAKTIVRHFANSAERNPMLYVECLFQHTNPSRFCELSSNYYVGEELRMMAERNLLRGASALAEDGEEEEDVGRNMEDRESITSGKNTKKNSDQGEQDEKAENKEHASSVSSRLEDDLDIMDSNNKQEREEINVDVTKDSMNDDGNNNSEIDEEQLSDKRQLDSKQQQQTLENEVGSNAEDMEDYVLPSSSTHTTPVTGHRKKRIRSNLEQEDESDNNDDVFGTEEEFLGATNSSRLIFDEDDE